MPYFAVAVGRKTGIYHTLAECCEQTEGFSNSKFKKFDTESEAEDYIRENSVISESVPVNSPVNPNSKPDAVAVDGNSPTESEPREQPDLEFTSDGSIVVYTHGGCADNGKKYGAGGIGVFWADNHPDNISQPLEGRQTNNRAEIHAAITAIRQATQNGHRRIIIRTVSEYLINFATKWIDEWLKNGWILSTGEPVKNKQDFLELIDVMHGMERVTWEKVETHTEIYDKVFKLSKDGQERMKKNDMVYC